MEEPILSYLLVSSVIHLHHMLGVILLNIIVEFISDEADESEIS